MIYSGSATKLLFALLHSSSTQLESYFTKSTSSFKAEKTTQQQDGSSSSGYAADAERARDDKAASDKENVAIISKEELTHEAEKHLKVKKKISALVSWLRICTLGNHDNAVMEKVHKRLFEEFKPLARDINLQLNCIEKSLVKEMKDDLKYVMSLKDELDETSLKNKLRKSKGNSVDTNFSKLSILRKPTLQPLKNQSVVRQPNTFKSERPKFSKLRFASQVDVKNDLSKPVTPHYWPKVRESAFVKPHHVITSSESRNSSKNMPRFSSNDIVHNHYLEEATKKPQERDRNSKTSVMPSTRLTTTANGSKPKPGSMNQMTRNWGTYKSSCVPKTDVPKAEHSRNSNSFLDFKRFVCLTCQKCVFNSNHNACITNLLKEVNSRGKKQSHQAIKRYTPIAKKSESNKHKRRIFTGQKFYPNKSSAVYVKTTPPRSGLTWKPIGRIFTYVGLRWIPRERLLELASTQIIVLTLVVTFVPESPRPHAHTLSSRIYSRHQSRLEDSSEFHDTLSSQDGTDLKEKDLKISELKSNSKEKAQDQRSQSMKEQAYNKDNDQDQDCKSLMSMQS
ncbi:hypothetical protein Tco_0294448 [Tanacetum coccineum]